MTQEGMKHYKLVLPEFKNELGNLFGGYLLKWIDELAYITVSLQHPGNRFVTVSMDGVEFKKPIQAGFILCFLAEEVKIGNTSATYSVKVFKATDKEPQDILFETKIVFVNIDEKGKKQKIK